MTISKLDFCMRRSRRVASWLHPDPAGLLLRLTEPEKHGAFDNQRSAHITWTDVKRRDVYMKLKLENL